MKMSFRYLDDSALTTISVDVRQRYEIALFNRDPPALLQPRGQVSSRRRVPQCGGGSLRGTS